MNIDLQARKDEFCAERRATCIHSWLKEKELGNQDLTTDDIRQLPLEQTPSSISISLFNRYGVLETPDILMNKDFMVHFGMTGYGDGIAACKALMDVSFISDVTIHIPNAESSPFAKFTASFPSAVDLGLSENMRDEMIKDVILLLGINMMMGNIAPAHNQSSLKYSEFLHSKEGGDLNRMPVNSLVH